MIGANAPGAAFFGEAFDAPVTWSLVAGGEITPSAVAAIRVTRLLALAGAVAASGWLWTSVTPAISRPRWRRVRATVKVMPGPEAAVERKGRFRVG